MPRAKELTLDESLAICDQFPDLLVQEVDFTGGEPVLNPDWTIIATHLAKHDITTKIITNGLALVPEKIGQMKDAGIAGIGVSLDGLEQTHDYIRGYTGLFRNILCGIEQAQKAGLAVTVITTANARNINELPLLATSLESIGINTWQVQPIFPLGRSHGNKELCLTAETYMQLGTFVSDWQHQMEEAGIQVMLADSLGYFTEFDSRQPVWRGCPAGLFSCGITSDGKIKGCLSLPDELTEGDLRENDLWDIWFDPGSFQYNRNFTVDKLGPFCSSCDMAEQCRGGCSAMSYGSSGKFHNDPYCFYAINERVSNKVIK